jgi:hypothetical protein
VPLTPVTGVGALMMASLGNKNKRRGFKQAAINAPAKIVFGSAYESHANQNSSVPSTSGSTADLVGQTPDSSVDQAQMQAYPLPRLVPPSERQEKGDVPSNVFVTSVDVEADLQRNRKGKVKKSNTQESRDGWEEAAYAEQEGVKVLDYGAAEEPENTTNGNANVDWKAAEAGFDAFPKLLVKAQLVAGRIVGWRALGLDPRTFTPENMVHLARVIGCDWAKDEVLVRVLARPEEEGEEGEEERVEWGRCEREDWRVVDV